MTCAERHVSPSDRARVGAAIRTVVALAVLAFVLGCQAPPQPAVPVAEPAGPAKPAPAAEKPVDKPTAAAPAPAKPDDRPTAAQPADKPAAPSKELKKIVVTLPSSSLLYTHLFVAKSKGLFEQEGLDVELIDLGTGGPAVAQSLVAGNAFIAPLPLNLAIDAARRNQPLVAVAASVNQNANMAIVSNEWAQKHNITPQTPLADKIKALKGARIGITAARSAVDDLARYLLVVYGGMNPDRDVQLVPLGGSQNFPPALEKQQVDAAVVASPAAETSIVRGHALLLTNVGAGEVPDLRGQVFIAAVVRREVLEKQRDVAAAAVRALARAQRLLNEQPDEAKRLLRAEKFARLAPEVWELAWANNLPSFAKSPVIDRDGYLINFTLGSRARGEPIDELPFDRLVDTALAAEAAKAVGLGR